MNLARQHLARIALATAALAASPAGHAQSLILSATGQLSGALITPQTMYVFGSSKLAWNSVMNLVAPDLSSYSEDLRQLTQKKALRLKPAPLPPKPAAVVFPNSYTQIYSFGDSMSDTGNLYAQMVANGTRGLPTAPSVPGRFCDGPVVLEAMANALKLPLVNYAFAGARSGYGNLIPVYGMQVGMLQQVQDLLANQPTATTPLDSHALYVLWTGPDDYYADGNIFNPATATTIVNNVKTALSKLYARGARHFYVPLMPDLSITPSAHDHNKTLPTYLSNAHARSGELATALTNALKTFAKTYPSATVHTFDTYTYSQQRMAQAAAEGINVTEPCLKASYASVIGVACDKPDQHLFWDGNHPTAAGSLVIGTEFARALTQDAALPTR